MAKRKKIKRQRRAPKRKNKRTSQKPFVSETWGEKFGREPFDYVLNTIQARKMVTKLRNVTSRRIAMLEKKHVQSYAAYQAKEHLQNLKPVKKMSLWELTHEISIHHSFWESRTATEAGAKEITRQQDSRIFGIDSAGRPLRTMSWDEREKFWSLYEEFYNLHPETAHFDSTRIQRLIGVEMPQTNFENIDMVLLLNKVHNRLLEAEGVISINDDNTVNYTGNWNGRF